MAKVSVSFRADEKKIKKLDKLAKQQRCDRTALLEAAIDSFLASNTWRDEQVALSLKEADSGTFATEEEVKSAFARWRE